MRGGVMSLTGRGATQTKEQTESQNERENTNSRAWTVLLETELRKILNLEINSVDEKSSENKICKTVIWWL